MRTSELTRDELRCLAALVFREARHAKSEALAVRLAGLYRKLRAGYDQPPLPPPAEELDDDIDPVAARRWVERNFGV